MTATFQPLRPGTEEAGLSPAGCRQIFIRVHHQLHRGEAPPIEVAFYPYADLDHTIRRRAGRLLVRLSDIAADAPAAVIEALAYILLCKLLRKKIPARYNQLYRHYAQSPEVRAETAHTRALRGRPSPGKNRGEHGNLDVLFARLNERYFEGQLQGVRLLWSRNRSMTRLGYYRRTFHTIVISRVLDDPRIPGFILEFILYHEMLHAFMPSVVRNGRCYDHTPDFRAAERRFERFEEADRYLRAWPPRELRRRLKTRRPIQLRLF